MNETPITVMGNICADPELRRLDNGIDVANFRIASTARKFDRDTRTWANGETLFMRVTCWRSLATNVSASLHRGDPVIVTGRLIPRSYVTGDGQSRTALEIEAEAVGPNLRLGFVSEFARPNASSPPATSAAVGEPAQPVAAVA